MNKELKQKWVDALRSGKYEQGIGFLQKDNKFCCLGVLCDILGEKWEPQLECGSTYGISGNYHCLPPRISEKFFIPGYRTLTESQLMRMNDHGETFNKIADYIEANIGDDE